MVLSDLFHPFVIIEKTPNLFVELLTLEVITRRTIIDEKANVTRNHCRLNIFTNTH